MRAIQLILTLSLTISTQAFSKTAPQDNQYSGINQVSFHEKQYDKAFAGNGFLIQHNNKTYAVTVKHALFEAKTPDMDSVDIAPYVASWKIHPNHKPNQALVLGKLLNSSTDEKLDMQILQKDWLVFEVKENKSNLSVLTLREEPLEKGEVVVAYGCSYANAKTCKQDTYTGKFIKAEENNLRIALTDWEPAKLRGLSGSPVLDKNNKVVGIVSNVIPSESGEGFDFAPANLDYLRKVLDSLTS